MLYLLTFFLIGTDTKTPTNINPTHIRIRFPQPTLETALANKEAGTATSAAITNTLKDFSTRRKDDFEKVQELLLKVQKAEQAAERARKQVLEATKDIEKNQKRKVFASDKLKDAEFLGQDSILLLTEGNSAAASMAVARDIKKYGILAIRGM